MCNQAMIIQTTSTKNYLGDTTVAMRGRAVSSAGEAKKALESAIQYSQELWQKYTMIFRINQH